MIFLSEADFEATYQPRTRADGELFTFDELQASGADLHHVWSIVEGHDGGWYAMPGYHVVNMLGYVLTAVPWATDNLEAIWYAPDGDDDYNGDDEAEADGEAQAAHEAEDPHCTCNDCIEAHARRLEKGE